jgi:hypothetical protein
MGMSDYTILMLTTSTLRCRHCTCELTLGLRKCSGKTSNIHVHALVPENIYHMEFPNLLPSVKYCFWPYAIWHHPSLLLSKSLLSSCYKLGVWWSCLQEETSHQNKRVVQVAALRLSGVCEYFFCNRWYKCARVHFSQVMPCNLILIVSVMMMRYVLLHNRWIHISIFVSSVRQLCWTGGSSGIYHLSANLSEIWLNYGRNFKEWIWTINSLSYTVLLPGCCYLDVRCFP